jgi:hypothetical protein
LHSGLYRGGKEKIGSCASCFAPQAGGEEKATQKPFKKQNKKSAGQITRTLFQLRLQGVRTK